MTEAHILLRKSMDWFLYDNDLRHERINVPSNKRNEKLKSIIY